jgi:hypothetical protein
MAAYGRSPTPESVTCPGKPSHLQLMGSIDAELMSLE